VFGISVAGSIGAQDVIKPGGPFRPDPRASQSAVERPSGAQISAQAAQGSRARRGSFPRYVLVSFFIVVWISDAWSANSFCALVHCLGGSGWIRFCVYAHFPSPIWSITCGEKVGGALWYILYLNPNWKCRPLFFCVRYLWYNFCLETET
jgi:hypothetical protein